MAFEKLENKIKRINKKIKIEFVEVIYDST